MNGKRMQGAEPKRAPVGTAFGDGDIERNERNEGDRGASEQKKLVRNGQRYENRRKKYAENL